MAEKHEPKKNPWFVPEHRQGQPNLRAGTVILPPGSYDALSALQTDFSSMVGDTIAVLTGEEKKEEVTLGENDRRAVRGGPEVTKVEIAGAHVGRHGEWFNDSRIDADFPRYPEVYSAESYERIPHEQLAYFLSEARKELERNPDGLTAAERELLSRSDQADPNQPIISMIIEEFMCRGIGLERQNHIIEQAVKFLHGQEIKVGGSVEIPSLHARKVGQHGTDPLYWEFWPHMVAGEKKSESEAARPTRTFTILQGQLSAIGFQDYQSVDPIRNIWARRMHRITAEMLQSLINRVTCDIQYRSPSGEILTIEDYRIHCDYADVMDEPLSAYHSVAPHDRYSPCSVTLEQFKVSPDIALAMRKFCLSALQGGKVKPLYRSTALSALLKRARYYSVESAIEFLIHWIEEIGQEATIADLFERGLVEVVDKNPASEDECPVTFNSASRKLQVALDALSGDSVLNYCDTLVGNVRLVPDAERTLHPALKKHLFPS